MLAAKKIQGQKNRRSQFSAMRKRSKSKTGVNYFSSEVTLVKNQSYLISKLIKILGV